MGTDLLLGWEHDEGTKMIIRLSAMTNNKTTFHRNGFVDTPVRHWETKPKAEKKLLALEIV